MLSQQIRAGLVAMLAVSLIACREPTAPDAGEITVMVSVTGFEIDANAFILLIDGKEPRPIAAGTPLTLDDLPPGSYNLRLDGAAANCTVGGNPRTIRVVAGQIASTTFEVVCIATLGGIRVTITTTGTDPDPGYTLSLGTSEPIQVGTNDQTTFSGLTAGDYTLRLGDVAPNCAVSHVNPLAASVVAGEVTALTFSVQCVELRSDALATSYVLVTVDGVALPVPDLSGRGAWDYGDYLLELIGLTKELHDDGTYTDVWSYRETSAGSIRYFTETVRGLYEVIDASTVRFGGPNGTSATITSGGMILNLFDAFILTFVRAPG